MVLSLLAFLQQALMAWRPEAMFLTQIIICPTGVGVEQVVAVVVAAAVREGTEGAVPSGYSLSIMQVRDLWWIVALLQVMEGREVMGDGWSWS